MRAMAIEAFGGPENLHMIELPDPQPGDGEVRVQLQFVAVNPADFKFRQGLGRRFPGYKASFPYVLGLEGAGVIDQVGAGVTQFAPGDRVVVRCDPRAGAQGSYAQLIVANQAGVAKIPDGTPMVDAATMPVAGVTAYQAVIHEARAGADKTFLVHGAAGGVGGFAVEFAKAAGARVVATCHSRNRAYVERLGADGIIPYDAGPVAAQAAGAGSDGYDAIIDCVGGHTLEHPLALLKAGGIDVRIITLSDSDNESPSPDEAAAQGKRVVSKVVDRATAQADMTVILALMAAGKVAPPQVDVLPLHQAGEAHRRLEARLVRGKLLLEIT